jgi:hypothetical protein
VELGFFPIQNMNKFKQTILAEERRHD